MLEPLGSGTPAGYRRFDWATDRFAEDGTRERADVLVDGTAREVTVEP